MTLELPGFARSSDKLKPLYISTIAILMATKRGRMVAYFEWLTPIKSRDPLISGFARSPEKLNISCLCYHKTMVIKLGKVVSYLKGFPHIKSHYPLSTWLHEVAWQMKYVISLLPQGLWLLDVARWWLIMRGFQP